MEAFKELFNKAAIYNTFFINVKSVLAYPTLADLESDNPKLYDSWYNIEKTRNKGDLHEFYKNNAPNYHEFTKIVSIAYGYVYLNKVDGKKKRSINCITNENEYALIGTFIDILHKLPTEPAESIKMYFTSLCGHNIINYDIPVIIKTYLKHIDNFDKNKLLPNILKNILMLKPWESGVMDISNLWKFNGYGENTPMEQIADYLGLVKVHEIIPHVELSNYYWDNIRVDTGKTLKTMEIQAKTQIDLAMQFMNRIRQF